MKIVFDTNNKNNKYEIKISIGEGLAASSTIVNIGIADSYIRTEDQIDNAIKKVLDNTRFTVKERQNAEAEVVKFLGYIKNEIGIINPVKDIKDAQYEIQSILENDENDHKIDDEEILNEQ